MTRVIFMGTPEFACSILQTLLEERYNVVAVVTQPDKKVGRAQTIVYSPVKQLALDNNIPVIQPISIKQEYQEVLDYQPDLIVTCAYGQIVPEIILNTPKYGCVNVHASLLPRLRGGAPIHKSIMYGEKETGVTLMYMAKRMDAGDMLAKRATPIVEDDTVGSLHDRLMGLGSELVKEELPRLLNGELVGIPQNESEATFAYNVSKEEEFVDFTKSQQEIYDHIRSLIPWPVSYGIIKGKKMKFWGVSKGEIKSDSVVSGTVVSFEEKGMKVKAGEGYVYISAMQMEGKSKMSAKDFYNGFGKQLVGEVFATSM
ncbi:MAG: methionyl-tRNA formyltransferase [Erysipelotrichaceae bacterium]|nr:methionyl-tRNA formyltransferase [Erysipelotrichaceae bacterium]